jgi:hypothetical protein
LVLNAAVLVMRASFEKSSEPESAEWGRTIKCPSFPNENDVSFDSVMIFQIASSMPPSERVPPLINRSRTDSLTMATPPGMGPSMVEKVPYNGYDPENATTFTRPVPPERSKNVASKS